MQDSYCTMNTPLMRLISIQQLLLVFEVLMTHGKKLFLNLVVQALIACRGQQLKQVMSRAGVVPSDVLACREAAGAGNDSQQEHSAANHLFGCGVDPLQSSPFCHCAPWVPNYHVMCQDTIDGRPTESYKHLPLQLCFLQHPEEVQSLLGLLNHRWGIGRPGEFL